MRGKRISSSEYKGVILDILKYIDNQCRSNNIRYSLIGGSLIGAIREKGIIPWDDDIDIVMNRSDYEKLIKIISNDQKTNYFIMNNNIDKTYPLTFSKIIDSRTRIIDPELKMINNYGAYVDIFVNHYTSNNFIFRKMHYYRIKFYQKLINGCMWNEEHKKNENILKKVRTKISNYIGIKKLQNRYKKIISKYDENKTNYVIKDYTYSNYNIDVIESKYFDDYIDVDFEDMKAMAVKEYDKYLKNIFGDYMVRPSKENQICHDIIAYWKE